MPREEGDTKKQSPITKMPGIARAGAQPESDTEEAERDILQLEAEPDDAYGNFHNDLPAYLLAKVDGDELAHLLESGHATPFDTPRAEDEAPEEEPEEEAVEEEEEQPTHTIKKPETTIDKTVLVPGEADNETEMNRQAMGGVVEMQRQEESIRQAAHRSRVDAIDAALEGEWQHDDERHGVWSVSHARLLYLISIFANESPYPDDDEPWIKELHLMVFIYELIEAALLPFCKVPQWMMAVDDQGKSQKIWLLIAQEAVGFINDLCKRGFVHVLRVSTEDGWSENAYRCTAQGIEFLRSAPEKLKSQVDHVVTDRRDGETFEVVIQDMGLYMKNRSGYRRKSSVTEIGKLPYVTSPYFASSIRHIDCVLKDNSALAYECVLWPSQVPDDRDEAVVLANVSIILAEWMMTGSNSIGLMIEALEGSVFSERDAHSVTFTTSQAGGGLMMTLSKKTSCSDELKTRSTIIDFQPSIDLNFEAEIIVQGEAAVKRVENFGVHVHENGVIMCAVQVEALQDREWDDLAPSLLANMIKELHYNSSLIIHPMMSKLQNDVLSSLYDGSPMSRTKTLCILADTIEPQLKAIEYMDGGRYQKEFVQLLGEVHTCRDLTDDDIIFIGKEGVLLAGPKSRELEYLIVKYVSLMVIDQGIIGIYARLRRLSNTLEACHRMILKRRQQVVDRVNPRDVINKAGQHLRLMWMMQESIDQSIKKFAPVNRPSDHTHQRLWEMLDFIAYKNDIILRCNDLDRTLRRTQNEVRTLTDIQDIEDRIDLEEVFEMAHKDTEKLSVPPNATLNHFGEVHMRSEVPLRIITVLYLCPNPPCCSVSLSSVQHSISQSDPDFLNT